MRFIVSIFFAMILTLTISFADENDTATIENILPNAGDTSSSLDNFDLDGVQSGSSNVALTNNSTHNGFTITCDTQVSNACGKAFTGELEASHDMKVSASGTLVGLTGVDESNNSHTSNQKKLDGGIGLDSYFSVQNCEWSSSSHRCGDYTGSVDSYSLHIKIKNSSGDTLAEMTTTRTDDAGYYTNSQKFSDSLIYNGVGANSYEWYWKGIDGSESTTTITRGPNLLGAELNLAFPTDEYEVFTTEEIEELNPLGNITPEETVVTGWVKVEEELNQDQEKSEKIETEIKETLSEMKNSDSIDPLVDEGDPAPASSVVTKTGETADEWNARRTEEITKENDLIIEREQKAEEIRKHAQLHKREQIVKMERSGFWGWLRGFFG